jgi:AcrR family transcriptional regulator
MGAKKTDGRRTNTRKKLLYKAIRLFWLRGYTEVGINTIAKEANVQKGSLYYFFPSKVDLLEACLELMSSLHQKKFEALNRQSTSSREAVLGYLHWLLDTQLKARQRYGFIPGFLFMSMGPTLLTEGDKLSAHFARSYGIHVQQMQSLLDNTRGENSPTCSALSAASINYLFEGAMWRARITNSIQPLKEAMTVIEQLLKE